MDMMTRTAFLAGGLVLLAIAAAAGWWFWGDDLLGRSAPPDSRDIVIDPSFDDREGSLLDEFGETSNDDTLDDRIIIRTGQGLELPPPPAGTIAGLPDGPRFEVDRPAGEGRLGPLPGPLPRSTASERVEADCRHRGGGSYACRCLVRLARTALAPAEFEFLSYAEDLEPRAERLSSAGLELTDLPGVTIKLVELDTNARRRCGAGLKP